MNEQELREKIVGVVLDVPITGIKIREILGGEATANNIAEALIAAGMGDVSEYKKHKVLVDISPAFKGKECISVPDTPSKIIQLYNTEEVEQIVKERDEYKHRAEVAERALKRELEVYADNTCPYNENSKKCKECGEKMLCSTEYATQCYFELAIQQAEKELKEEVK